MPKNVVAICRELRWDEGNVPEWVQLLPLGPDVVGNDGRAWVIDDPDALAAALTKPVPLDWEHSTELCAPRGEPAPAAGWIQQLAVFRDEAPNGPGIWGRIDWTPRGADSVRQQEYRFISPVFTFGPDKRIQRLLSAALTNRPNLDLKALNRASDEETNSMDEEQRKALAVALGLGADAKGDAIVAQAKALNARATELTTNLAGAVPKAEHEKALNRVSELEAEVAKRDVADFETKRDAAIAEASKAGRLAPAGVDATRALCTRENFDAWKRELDARPPVIALNSQGQGGAPGDSDALSAEEQEMKRRYPNLSDAAIRASRKAG